MRRALGSLAGAVVLAAAFTARADETAKQPEQKAYTIAITGVG